MPFYELKTTILCQNDDLMNHAANCETFRKINTHAEYFSKYSKPLSQNDAKLITKCGSFLITKQDKPLLQNAAAFLLQNKPFLLQNVAGITKCAYYYKTRYNILFDMR